MVGSCWAKCNFISDAYAYYEPGFRKLWFNFVHNVFHGILFWTSSTFCLFVYCCSLLGQTFGELFPWYYLWCKCDLFFAWVGCHRLLFQNVYISVIYFSCSFATFCHCRAPCLSCMIYRGSLNQSSNRYFMQSHFFLRFSIKIWFFNKSTSDS